MVTMKTYQFIAAIAFATFVLTACNKPVSDGYTNHAAVKEFVISKTTDHPGKKLMEQQCYVCHNPSSDHDGRIAPPMVAVKSHYMTDSITKKQFTDAIWNFVEKPSEEKSKMRGAVRRFNLMPFQPFDEGQVRLIADYMYQYKIDEPDWFKKHVEEESNGNMKYHNEGRKIDGTHSEEKQTPEERGLGYSFDKTKY
tara:strand:- start:84867 stop:85454 length:588 start_codon:yes stop_codon:yes gene_type:complete